MNANETQIKQLGSYIAQFSQKAATAYVEQVSEVAPLLSPEELVFWVEMGSLLAQGSAIASVKYFRESPQILKEMGSGAPFGEILRIGVRLARQNYGVALEFFRQCPRVMTSLTTEALSTWAQVGGELGLEDYGTAIEYFKGTPEILHSLAPYQLEPWGKLGLLLSKEDLKTKDFLGLEFFRLSAETLGKIGSSALRSRILTTTTILAKTSGKLAMDYFKESPAILAALRDYGDCSMLFDLAETLTEASPSVVLDYLRHSPDVLKIMEGSLPKFEAWAHRGIEMAKINPDGAKAYFSLRLKGAQETARQLSQGLFLREIARTLRLFAEGICGKPVEIRSGSGPSGIPTTAGGIITLPEKLTLFPTIDENFRFYKVMVLHEAGHLEFGTYDPIPPELFETLPGLPKKTLQSPPSSNLSGLLGLFPDPLLARNLWTIVEEGRIDYLLHHEYPGIRRDMDFVISQQLKGRPNLFELPPKQALLEALLQLSVTDTTEVPLGLAEEVSQAYAILKTVQHPTATLVDSIRAVASLYPLLEKYQNEQSQEKDQDQPEETPANPPPEFALEGHEPIVNFAYRGPLDLSEIDRFQTSLQPAAQGPLSFNAQEILVQPSVTPPQEGKEEKEQPAQTTPPDSQDLYLYDEWDYVAGDFKPQWCRLQEKELRTNSTDFMDGIKSEYGGMILSLRRYFECLRPEAFKKIKKQEYGEEIDLESAIEAFIEKKAQRPPSYRVYTRREKKARDVSVAFLIDMSGSTSQQLEGLSKRVIDVQKEGLILLAEALDAIGDEYALFGFSGHSRNQIDCYRIKGFDEPYGRSIQDHIGGIQSLGQNRDGAAIRHMTHKLMQRTSKIKLLILISDGKPLDDDYSGTYALEDTKMALRQARALGIYPFCITVDQMATEYIEKMYGEVSYTIIQNVNSLPQKLPRIYKALTT